LAENPNTPTEILREVITDIDGDFCEYKAAYETLTSRGAADGIEEPW
jgi:hypothetical protein